MAISIDNITNQSSKISNLVNIAIKNDKKLIENLENKKKELDSKINVINNIKNLTSSLKSIISQFVYNFDIFESKKVLLSRNDVLEAKVTSKAVESEFEIEVLSLANKHIISSSDFTDSSNIIVSSIGSGVKNFSVRINDTLLNLSVELNENNSDYEILQKINKIINTDEKISKYLTSSIINKGNNTYVLIIESKKTGINNRIRFEGDSSLLSALGITDSNLNIMKNLQEPENLLLRIYGVEVVREKNIVEDIIEGITFDIKKTGKVNIKVFEDSNELVAKLKEFVTSYNKLQTAIGKYIYEEKNQTNNSKGVLYSDPSFKIMRMKLKEIISNKIGNFSLVDLGFKYCDSKNYSKEENFNIEFNEEKFISFLKNNKLELKELLVSNNGIFTKLYTFLNDSLSNKGLLESYLTTTQKSIENFNKKISNSQKLINQKISYYQALYSTLSNRASSLKEEGSKLISILSNVFSTKLF
ncbi:MAG: flagellar filament capping protein FliD [Elusimicrobiales bacterium]|nr:flagellar filament capping protein FliD [Elusimicrobiales bacterium]